MRYGILVAFLLMACGGSLSDEQRQRLREGMEDQSIVKMSDSEIVAASLGEGREVLAALEATDYSQAAIDSLEGLFHVRIRKMVPGSDPSLEIENQVIDAYVLAAVTGSPDDSLQDNIQRMHVDATTDYDTLLYSKPIVEPMPDGVVNILGVWNVYIAKKEVIRRQANKH